ncbi:MAG: metal ABC transporter ATP-binding protein [Desulfosudaceae bacterium]
MSGENEPVIRFENVSYCHGRWPILEDISLTVSAGDFVAVVGPNGGGKTTFLKLILGLLQPTRGRVRVFGESPQKACRRTGYLPQYAHLDPQYPVNVMEVVLMGRLGSGFRTRYRSRDREIAEKSLEKTGVRHLADRNFSELSGGQRQRVLIARALCTEPELLLLDEPTANVDPGVEEALFEVLRELNREMTVLLVSHDMGFVSRQVKSVVCVNRNLVVHPTSAIEGRVIKDIYGQGMRLIRHDHRCSERGHECD